MVVQLTVGELRALVAEAVADALAELELGPRPPPALLTKPQVAHVLGLSVPQVDRLRREGLPWLRVGDAVRFELDAVMDWVRVSRG